MDVINHYHNGGIQYVSYLIHTFCVYVFVLCVLVVLFRQQAFKWVMVPDSTGLYVGLVGWCDIHCKFLSTFRQCVLPNESVYINFRLHVALHQTYKVYIYCILYHFLIFFLIFCLCLILPLFMYKFITFFFSSLWDQYSDSIVHLG